jgi:hypothetical protein
MAFFAIPGWFWPFHHKNAIKIAFGCNHPVQRLSRAVNDG